MGNKSKVLFALTRKAIEFRLSFDPLLVINNIKQANFNPNEAGHRGSNPALFTVPQMNAEDTANLVSFLEKQKSRYQVASREIAELKKSLAEIQNSDGGTASDAVQQLRNEVGTLRARVCGC